MPTEKEFEGKTWVLKTDVDEIVAGRLSEVTRKKNDLEARIASLEKDLDGAKTKGAQGDAAAAQIAELREQLAAANARYDRHSAMAAHGILDPDVRDAVEWAYERTNSKLPKKDQRPFTDTLDDWVGDNEKAPASIRHHLVAEAATEGGDAGAGADAGDAGDAGGDDAAGAAGGTQAGAGAKKPAAGTGAKPLPKKPKAAPTKPSPHSTPVTLDDIYGADDKKLDELVKQYKSGGAAAD
jgi:hypothetical protein